MSSPAWSSSRPETEVVDPRPAAVLGAAAAVPLGVAVLLAAGLLPWGARVAVGLAIVVLGVRIRALPGTVLGARVGAATARAIGLAVLVAGGLVAIGALAVGIDGGSIVPDEVGASSYAGVFSVGLSALPASLLGLLVAAGGGALAWWAGPDRGARTVGEAAVGCGAAVLLSAVVADGALGLGGSFRAIVLVLVAALATGLWLRAGREAPWSRAAGVFAGATVALLLRDAPGLVESVVGSVLLPNAPTTSPGAFAVATAVGLAVAVVLVAAAVDRRDPVVGALPVGVLLLSRSVDHGVGQVGVLVVPVLLGLLATATVGGVGPLARRLQGSAAVALFGIAVVVLAVVLDQAIVDVTPDPSAVDGGRVAASVVAILALGLVVALAHGVRERAGRALAIAALLLVFSISPIGTLSLVDPGSFLDARGALTALLVLELLVGGSVLLRHRTPLVLATAALVVVGTVGRIAFALVLQSDLDSPDVAAYVGVGLGIPALALVGAATLALAGPAGRVRGAQAVACGLAFATTVNATGIGALVGLTDDAGRGQALQGVQAVVPVLVALLLALGLALLAASATRRRSATAALVAAFGTGLLGAFVATVAGALGSGPSRLVGGGVHLLDPATGFAALGTRQQDASGAWPVLFALLGLALLGAAAWLESRRPLPADAPLG